jgi:hypothetical protein
MRSAYVDTGPAEQPNILFLMSDPHAQKVAGCYGDPIIRTPHLDPLGRTRCHLRQRLLPLTDLHALAHILADRTLAVTAGAVVAHRATARRTPPATRS